jgi:hypothetical protein
MRRSIFNRGIMAMEGEQPQLEDPTNAPAPGEGEATPPAAGEGEGTPPAEGEGTPPAEGEGESTPPVAGEGEGEVPPTEGEGETPPVEGETPPAEGETLPVEGETPPAEGEGEVPPVEGEGEVPPTEGETPPGAEGTAGEGEIDELGELEDVPEHAESAEADMAELNAERGEIDAHDNAIDEAEAGATALEAIREQLILADKEGGLTRGGAGVLRVSLEHIYGRLGIPTDKVTPAMESFGGSATRQSSTQIAIENLSETAANIWKKIVEWSKKIWDWIVKWYNKLFDTNTKVKARAEALKQVAATVAKAQKQEQEIDNAGLAKALSFANGVNFDETVTSLDHFVKQFNNGASKYFGSIQKLIESVKSGANPGNQNADQYSFGLQKESSIEGVSAPDGAAMYSSPELPGRVRIVSVWSEANVEHCQFKKINLPVEGEATKVPTLDSAQIERAADLVIEITTAVANSRQGLDAAGGAFKELMAAAESNINGMHDGQEGENVEAKTQGNAKLAIARKAQELLKEAATQVNHYLVDVAEKIVGWGELSAKAHGKAEGTGEAAPAEGEAAKPGMTQQVKDAANKAGEAAKQAGAKIGEAAGKAGSAIKEAGQKVADKVTGKPDPAAEAAAAEKRAKLKEQASA